VALGGGLFTLSLTDASCHPVTSYQPSGQNIIGPGFVEQNGSDSMYACTGSGVAGGPLVRIALPTYSVQVVGDYTSGIPGQMCKLTGTGDGRLFGLFHNFANGGSTLALAEINTTSGATPNPVDMSSIVSAKTFESPVVFWGGDFWFFITTGPPDLPPTSKVIRYRYSTDRSLVVVIADTGFYTSGAAVSTCAPLVATQ
jgi:hypothetical protein